MSEGRVIAIGDIHGCSAALAALVRAIEPTEPDTIVFLGDYIDRGPDSRGVLGQVIALTGRCTVVPLLGNHEEMLLAALEGQSELRYWLKFGGTDALASYGYKGGPELPPADLRVPDPCRAPPVHQGLPGLLRDPDPPVRPRVLRAQSAPA
jgi:serine/threonine protein phosphatase 1